VGSHVSRSTEKDPLAQALDQIHSHASRTDTFTSFDFVSPQQQSPSDARGRAGELMSSGFSGLYNRLKATVGGNRDTPVSPVDAPDDGLAPGSKPQLPISINSANVSASSSRLVSPAVGTFQDAHALKTQNLNNLAPLTRISTKDKPVVKALDLGPAEALSQPSQVSIQSANSSKDGIKMSRTTSNTGRSVTTDYSEDATPDEDRRYPQDMERTPRPLARLGLERGQSAVQLTSQSPARKSNKEKEPLVAATLLNVPSDVHRPLMMHVGQSHLPGFTASRETSVDGEYNSVVSGPSHKSGPAKNGLQAVHLAQLPDDTNAKLRSKILAKELWMRDETAKECFYCGEPFSTFRRKHHCRICGNIFDDKCTNLVNGKLLGQYGRVRVCKPCEAVIHGDDDSSVYSDEPERALSHVRSPSPRGLSEIRRQTAIGGLWGDDAQFQAPSLGIPFARKGGESKRGSAIIEFANDHTLQRPTSSRSLKSLSGLHRGPTHRRHHSRPAHQHMKNIKSSHLGVRAPFQGDYQNGGKARLRDMQEDVVVDPDMVPFMSDVGSSDDDTTSIFATLNNEATSPGKGNDKNFSSMMGPRRKVWKSERGTSVASRDPDNVSLLSKSMTQNRRRNPSISSLYHDKPSPKRSKSNSLLRGFTSGFPAIGQQVSTSPKATFSPPRHDHFRMIRSSAMRGESAPAVELNQISLQHVQSMLRQMLMDADIAESKRWEKALTPIMLQCTDDVNMDIKRNDDMDIRHYIKLKKIPGGRPGDTAYVSGVVFTKNLALKSMARNILSPRILLLTFPLEYARHNSQFMSLQPVIAQEREYLSNLVKRIMALSPNVLLVEKNVSGLALSFLDQAGISVAYNVKLSVLNAVSRCTQTQLITSPDQLALDPNDLGTCESFNVKTYVHNGFRRTLIYFTGCQKELGCTIVLRGAEMERLRKIKRITEFMCYVVYNLKLETCMMRDEYVLIPTTLSGGTISASQTTIDTESPDNSSAPSSATTSQQLNKSDVSSSNQTSPSESTLPTSGPSRVSTFTPSTGASSTTKASSHEGYQYNESINSISPSFYNDLVEEHKTKIISSSPFVRYMQPYLLTQARKQEARLVDLKRLRDQYYVDADSEQAETGEEKFELVQPEMVHKLIKKPTRQVRDFLFAVHDAEYERAMHVYNTQKKQWEAYIASSPSMFEPLNHQRIAFLYSMVNSKMNPCFGPEILALGFYNEHDLEGEEFVSDITLGTYIEDLIDSAESECTATDCMDNMMNHNRQYVHGEGQMTVTIENHPPRFRDMQHVMLMWSKCRICGKETQVTPMSENTWKYSFAKYLELTFWGTDLYPRAHTCPHDVHKDHVRYFGFRNKAVQIQYDTIQLYEIISPRATITWKVDRDLRLKNNQYTRFKNRLDRFMRSVKQRIDSIHVESMPPEKLDACREEVIRLMNLVKHDYESLTKNLQDKYSNSRWYEIVPMNLAARAIHENSIGWDEIFADFERNFFPSEKDIRRMTALQIKKIFESATSFTSMDDAADDEAVVEIENDKGETEKTVISGEISPSLARRMSILSQDDAEGVLASVVKELIESPKDEGKRLKQEEGTQASATQNQTAAEEAEQRDDIQHLDLAIPPSPVLEKKNSMSPPQLASPDLSGRQSPEKTRSALRAGNMTEFEPSDNQAEASRIPRPTNQLGKLSKLPIPPGLNRAQSQPHGTPLKALTTGADMTEYLPLTSPQHIHLSRGDKLRSLLSEPARAFERRIADRLRSSGRQSQGLQGLPPSMIPRSVPGKRHVFSLARHYEQLQKEFEKQRMRERQLRESRGAYPLASSKPIVEVYRNAQEAVKAESQEAVDDMTEGHQDTARTSIETASTSVTASGSQDPPAEVAQTADQQKDGDAESLHSKHSIHEDTTTAEQSHAEDENDEEESQHATGSTTEETSSLSPTDASSIDLIELGRQEGSSLLKMLTNFWGERSSSGWTPLEYPFAGSEHVWGDSPIIVREDEPSSIIALALSSGDYLAKLKSFRREPAEGATPEEVEESISNNLSYRQATNIRYAFQNRGVKAQCKIFYAESFDALRRKTGVSERFVESLSRCLKWDSKGGKTKSLFLKTLDDRFVLKSLSPVEVNSFFKFAPDYFSFVHAMLFNGLPSVIAKIFGLFQVTVRNAATGGEFNWYMIVMENLFYDRELTRRFDLKGSMRNRRIESTGERDEVLLDENLVDIIFEKPIFVREHTLKQLKASVWNDTLFLSKQDVMDYSLMAGFEDEKKDIIVGIIDCIRTYTWDKKLETWIKDRGKHKPTVTSPKDYRNRFRVAMGKYILQAPNCWHQFGPGKAFLGREVKLSGGAGRKLDDE
jgi:1-phosphatidylinositol-3-phosphate 5-kinase